MRRTRKSKGQYVEGDHNVISDRSGQKYKRSQCRYTWDGWLVADHEWEERQPQDLLTGKDEQIGVEDSRPRQPVKNFVPTKDDL